MLELCVDMGRSSLVLICCVNLMLMEQANALTPSKSITIYGLEQGSRFKAPKRSSSTYLLQLASFTNHNYALEYKTKLESQFKGHLRLITSEGYPTRYRLVLGPFANASELVALSKQVLAQQANKNPIKKLVKKQITKIKIVQVNPSILPAIASHLIPIEQVKEEQTSVPKLQSKPRFSYLPQLNYGASVTKYLKNISGEVLVNNEFSDDKQRTGQGTPRASYLPSFVQTTSTRQYPYQNREEDREQKNQNVALAENEPRRKAWASIKGKSPDITRPLVLDKSNDPLNQSYIAPLFVVRNAPIKQQQEESDWARKLFLAIQKHQPRRKAWAFIKGKFTDVTNYISLVPFHNFQSNEQKRANGDSFLPSFNLRFTTTEPFKKNRRDENQQNLFLVLKESKPRRKAWAYINGKFTDISHSTTLYVNSDSSNNTIKQATIVTQEQLLEIEQIASALQKNGSFLPPLPKKQQENENDWEKNIFLSHKEYKPRRKGWALIKGRFTDITNPSSFDLTADERDLAIEAPSYIPPRYVAATLSQIPDETQIVDHWYKALVLERKEEKQKQKAYQLFQGKTPTLTSLLPFDQNRNIEIKEQSVRQNKISPEQQINNTKQNMRTSFEPLIKTKPLGRVASASDMTVQINIPSNLDMQSMEEEIAYNDHGKNVKIDLKHYNAAIFTLAYDVFVMNDNIRFAYRVANAAVHHDPTNIEWRKKLAQSALWAGNAEVALDQYLYFINHNYETATYITKALPLAKQLFNYDAQVVIYQNLLKSSPNDKALLLQYLQAMQNQGYPNKAFNMLKAIANSQTDPQFLEQLVNITGGTDQPKLELQYLQKLTSIESTAVKPKLEEADILFSQGDATAGYKLYAEVSSQIKPDDTNFWLGYADLALLSGNAHGAIHAFKTIMKAGNINKTSILQLIDLQQLDGQKEAALSDARIAYQKFPDDIRFPKAILSIGTDLNKWEEMKHFIDSLPAHTLAELNNAPDYAILIAVTTRHVGLVIDAFQGWKRILERWPSLTLVQNNYLWYLIDYHERRQLEFLIGRMRHVFALKPALWEAYSNALSNIGDYKEALRIMKQHREVVNKHYDMLLNIVDLFVQNDRHYEAHYLKRLAFKRLLDEIASHPENLSLTQTLAFAELVRSFGPASMTYNVMIKLGQKLFVKPEIDEQVIAWALESENYDLARFMIRTHELANIYTPPWMSLTLALEEGDRDLMEYLLTDSPKVLPYRDKVTAAVETGNIRLAQEYAYKGLTQHPFDHLMYSLFTETMLPWSNRIASEAANETWGNVSGPLAKLAARVFVTPSLSVTPYGRTWFPHTNDKLIIAWTPHIDETVGIAARQYTRHGWLELDVGERRSLAQVYPVIARWHRENIIPRLNSELILSYHVRADETTAMILGGMKNEVRLDLDYIYKSRDYYDAQIATMRFYGQDNFYLGSGTEFRAHWQHKFYISYPDWNFNFYYSWLDYHTQNRVLPLLLQKIIPLSIETPVSGFYMPISDMDEAITFGFGQQYKEQYTKSLKPFAEVGMLYSKLFGWGKIIEGGLATSLLGRDHLVLFGEYTTNQQQVNQVQTNQRQESQVYYIIGMKYDYFF